MQRLYIILCLGFQLLVLLVAVIIGAGRGFPGVYETILYAVYVAQAAATPLLAELTGWKMSERIALIAGWLAVLTVASAVNLWLDSGAVLWVTWLVDLGDKIVVPAVFSFLLLEVMKNRGVTLSADPAESPLRFKLREIFILLTVVAVVCCLMPEIARHIIRPLLLRTAIGIGLLQRGIWSIHFPFVFALLVASLTVLAGWMMFGKAKLWASCLFATGIALSHCSIIEVIYLINPMASDLPNVYLRMFYFALFYLTSFTIFVRLLGNWFCSTGTLQPEQS